ncbi:MAG: polysaccharide deacetylase family protein [Thermicanus sp.]|nr:polysaccharide deacetylase family protein [Thermicanus sp.]
MKRVFWLFFLLVCAIFLGIAGCGNGKPSSIALGENGPSLPSSTSPSPPSDATVSPADSPDSQDPSAKPEGESSPPETKARYYVDSKNFIHPVDPSRAEEKIILLTFDDAPSGKSTSKILHILDKYHAKAIWFVNGYYAEKHQELLKEIHEQGNLIGNHTWWHENLKKISPEKTKEEIVSLNDLVEKVTGVRPVYFRPPYGANSEAAYKVLKDEKMQSMNWTWGSLDWELKKPEEIEKNVLDHAKNGSTILFHDKEITAEALEGILKNLSDEGYRFVLPTEVTVKEE